MAATIQINKVLFDQMDRELAGMPQVSRMPAMKAAIKTGLKITETRYKDYVPKSSDRKEGKHLVETISSKVKEYPNGAIVGLVGAEYPAGAHAHFLEEGFRIVVGGTVTSVRGEKSLVYVEGQYYLADAVRDTESERDAAMLDGMKKAVEEAKKNG